MINRRVTLVKEVHPLLLTAALSVTRRFLVHRQFSELALPATTQYKIEGVKSYKLAPGKHMRYTAEPDIWLYGEHFDHFFWVGPCFRMGKADPLTGNEFTMVSWYARHKTTSQAVQQFFSLLREWETHLKVPALSKLPLRYRTHKEFVASSEDEYAGWTVVTEFPKNKSFYDEELASGNTSRFGVYLTLGGDTIAVASGGTVGENQNPKMRIRHRIPSDAFKDRLLGIRLGVERLLLLYEKAEDNEIF